MKFTSVVPYIYEWMSSRGVAVLVSKLEKGNIWLLPYWNVEHKYGVLFIEELQVFNTWLKILVEGWPSLLCHTMGSTLETITKQQTKLLDLFGW